MPRWIPGVLLARISHFADIASKVVGSAQYCQTNPFPGAQKLHFSCLFLKFVMSLWSIHKALVNMNFLRDAILPLSALPSSTRFQLFSFSRSLCPPCRFVAPSQSQSKPVKGHFSLPRGARPAPSQCRTLVWLMSCAGTLVRCVMCPDMVGRASPYRLQ